MKFALKAELKYRPYIMIGAIMTVTIFYIGFIIRTSEISFEFSDQENRNLNFERFKYVLDVAWLTIITMTTVGYGDLYAVTFFGRTFSVVAFILGNCLISLIVVVLQNQTDFSEAEDKAYNTLLKEIANGETKLKASDVIKTSLKLFKAKQKRDGRSFSQRFILYSKLKEKIKILK